MLFRDVDTLLCIQMMTKSNYLVAMYDHKLKKARKELDEASSLEVSLAKERETVDHLTKECEALRQERAQHLEELSRLEDNIAQAVGEKASLETKKVTQMARLRKSGTDWVRQERKFVNGWPDC